MANAGGTTSTKESPESKAPQRQQWTEEMRVQIPPLERSLRTPKRLADPRRHDLFLLSGDVRGPVGREKLNSGIASSSAFRNWIPAFAGERKGE